MVEEESEDGTVLNQPAGHLEDGETLAQAVVRETQEETAWVVKATGLTGVYHWQKDTQRTFIRFNFSCEAVREIPGQVLDDGIIAAHWMSLDEIKAERSRWRNPYIMDCIQNHQCGHVVPLEFVRSLLSE